MSLKRVYGFVMFLTSFSVLIFVIFLMVTPESYLRQLDATNLLVDVRNFIASLITSIGLTIYFIFSTYWFSVLAATPNLDSYDFIKDKYSRPWSEQSAVISAPVIGDLDKSEWSRKVVKKYENTINT